MLLLVKGNRYLRLEPFVVPGKDFVLLKGGNLVFRSWSRGTLTQLWSHIPSLAFRFGDRRIAAEYLDFLERMDNGPKGLPGVIAEVQSLPQTPTAPRVTFYAPPAEQKSNIVKWLTTYDGVS